MLAFLQCGVGGAHNRGRVGPWDKYLRYLTNGVHIVRYVHTQIKQDIYGVLAGRVLGERQMLFAAWKSDDVSRLSLSCELSPRFHAPLQL